MFKGNSQQAICWMAGFFDGEGTIGFGLSRKQWLGNSTVPNIWVSIGQKNREVLDFVNSYFPGKIVMYGKMGFTKNYFVWRLNSKTSRKFLKAIFPFLIVKRNKAAIAIELCKLRPGRGNKCAAAETERLRVLLRKLSLRLCNSPVLQDRKL